MGARGGGDGDADVVRAGIMVADVVALGLNHAPSCGIVYSDESGSGREIEDEEGAPSQDFTQSGPVTCNSA